MYAGDFGQGYHVATARQQELLVDAARSQRASNRKDRPMFPAHIALIVRRELTAGSSSTRRQRRPGGAATLMQMSMRRVGFFALTLGVIAATLLTAIPAGAAPGSTAGTTDAGHRSCDPCPMRTTVALNLREGPGTNYRVMLVMPAGAEALAGIERTNGFAPVTYNGTFGWAAAQYLVAADQPAPIGTGYTTVDLNLRAGPSSSHQVLRVMPQGSAAQTTNQVVNGYRYVIHQGLAGWAYDAYLSQSGGQQPGYGTTTAALNLRDQPFTTARILLVIPAGATVRLGDQFANGYRSVTSNGVSGWAYNAYIA